MRTFPRFAILAGACSALALSRAHAQDPEDHGPLTSASWDAGTQSLAGASIRVRVYYPDSGGPYPLVGVIHGANANGTYHTELATTLATRGFVAVVPDMPCTVIACDHDANQRQISALLEWAVAESADSTSRLAGKVDGSRRGLIGHSWGGLSSHITAARDPSIDSVVLLDPNDDGIQGLSVTNTITAPHLTLLAQVPGACNGAWQEAMVRTRLTGSHQDFVIRGSGHCDPGEMDVVCSFACGAGDRGTVPLFRRYAVAWTACVLAGDASMATWIDGASYMADVSGDVIRMPNPSGLAALPCQGGPPPDGGVGPMSDAGPPIGGDGGAPGSDAGVLMPGTDAGMPPAGLDAGPPGAFDAGDTGPSDGGCTCRAHRGGADASWLGLLALLGIALRLRTRRTT
ncbi:MAG: dienelactone hydrolase family protein [Sandaracinaceae bacterium]